MKKPYYFQQNEFSTPQFIGFADDWNGALNLIDTNFVYEMTVIDIMDEDLFNSLLQEGELTDEEIVELKDYFRRENNVSSKR